MDENNNNKNQLQNITENLEAPKLPELNKDKSFSEQAKDFVGAVATQEAISDEKLRKKVVEHKKEELESRAEAEKKKEQAQNKKAEEELQKATFGVYQGIAELIGLKKPLPEKMLRRLMFFVQPIVGLFVLLIGIPTAIIGAIMDGINTIAEKFSTFAETTQNIIKNLVKLALITFIVLIINSFLSQFGIDVIALVKSWF